MSNLQTESSHHIIHELLDDIKENILQNHDNGKAKRGEENEGDRLSLFRSDSIERHQTYDHDEFVGKEIVES